MLAANTQDLHPAHRRPKSDQDEGVDLRIIVSLGGFKKTLALLDGQVVDPPCFVLQQGDLRRDVADPSLLHGLVQEMRLGGEFPIDRSRAGFGELGLILGLHPLPTSDRRLLSAQSFVPFDVRDADVR